MSASMRRRRCATAIRSWRCSRGAAAGGLVLEMASGTGEHAVRFAPRGGRRRWQPSDPDAWPRQHRRLDAAPACRTCGRRSRSTPPPRLADRARRRVVYINMIHIAPWAAAVGLIAARRGVAAGGLLFLYGPFGAGAATRRPATRHSTPTCARGIPPGACAISKPLPNWLPMPGLKHPACADAGQQPFSSSSAAPDAQPAARLSMSKKPCGVAHRLPDRQPLDHQQDDGNSERG